MGVSPPGGVGGHPIFFNLSQAGRGHNGKTSHVVRVCTWFHKPNNPGQLNAGQDRLSPQSLPKNVVLQAHKIIKKNNFGPS